MDLTDEHIDHLDNLINGGLMRKVTPEPMESYLLQNGYARKAVGGLVATNAGQKIFMEYHKRNKNGQ